MIIKTTANHYVKVKLNDLGISILKEKRDNLNKKIKANTGKTLGEFELKVDEDGYYRTQIWSLMYDFGHTMYLGCEPAFDINDMVFEGPKER